MRRAETEDVPRVDALRPEVPRRLADVVQRALARRAADRWPSAAEMRRELAGALARRS